MTIPNVREGDSVQLRKAHPCGSDVWTVVRLGSDVVLYNASCDRRLTLSRSRFNKSVKRVLRQTPQPPAVEKKRGLA